MSGSPAVDGFFQTLWLAIICVQLWGFLYLVTIHTIEEGAFITGLVFAALFQLIVVTVVMLGMNIRS